MKKIKMEGWSDLPHELLYEITKKSLSVIDYLILGSVCRGWKSFAEEYKKEFMASQTPLALFFSSKAISFYSIFDQRLYKVLLPSPISNQNRCFGFTCGYLVFLDKKNRREDSQLWMLHPFTRHELRFHEPPKPYNRVILASVATPVPEFVLIAFCQFLPCFQVCRSTQTNWTQFDLNNIPFPWRIRDAIVFKGKIYVLTSEAEIGVLHLSPHLHVTLLNVGHRPHMDMNRGVQCLVSDGQHLMMVVSSLASIQHTVYELNFVHMEWMMMVNFADQALFLGRSMGSGFCNITRWEGRQQPSNCIYELGSRNRRYIVSFLDGRHHMFSQGNHMPNDSLFDPFWYFPHLSYNVDSLCLSDN